MMVDMGDPDIQICFSAFIYTEKIAMIWHNFFGFFR